MPSKPRPDEYLRAIIDNTNLVAYLKYADGRYIYVNRKYEQVSKLAGKDILGRRDHDFFPKELADLFRAQDEEVIAKRIPIEFDETIRLPDGVLTWITNKFPLLDEEGGVWAVGGVCTDITDRARATDDRLNEERAKAERLESLGTLAGGIAHDFNNMLTCIIGNLGIAADSIEAGHEARALLEETRRAAHRAAGLTQQLMTFSKGSAPRRCVTCVGELVRDAAAFASSGGTARVTFHIERGLWPADVDPAQIGQVVQNLVLNARQAMPGGGMISVRARNRPVAGEDGGLAPGRYVEVEVEDAGCGIPAEVRDRIFDPYFTTKKDGHGLGLAIAFSIVRKHGGRLQVESEEGRGARFSFLLPAADEAAPAVPASRPSAPLRGRVLLMDDDAAVRESIAAMLRQLGLDPVCARDAAEAVRAAKRAAGAKEPYDLLILDATIRGGRGGPEALRKLRRVQRSGNALVVSGYVDQPCMTEPARFGFSAALAKPFTLESLREAIAPLLPGVRASSASRRP